MARKKPPMRDCAVPGCGPQKIAGRGLCSKHWQMCKRRGTLEDYGVHQLPPHFDGERKTCGTCKLELSIREFPLNTNKANPSRRKSICQKCVNIGRRALKDARLIDGLCTLCKNPAVDGSNKCGFHRFERARWRSTPRARVVAMMGTVRARAKERGILCDLDEEWIKTRLAGVCELTGLPFDLEPGRRVGRFNPYAPSIDRIIAGSHYTKSNCRMIVMALNVGINYWGEGIYRHIAKAYLKQSRAKNPRKEMGVNGSYNLLLENTQSILTRKH